MREDRREIINLVVASSLGPCVRGERSDFLEESLEKWLLPGEEEVSDPRCGLVEDYTRCSECGDVRPIKHHCDDIGCPECYRKAVTERAEDATEKLLAAAKAYGRSPRHIVIGIPRRLWSSLDRKKMMNYVWGQVGYRKGGPNWLKGMYDGKWIGLRGALVIFHPFRFRDAYTGKGVAWKRYCTDPEGQFVRYYAPHFHMLAFGDYPDSVVMERKKDLIIKNKKARIGRESIQGTVYYHLSHAGVIREKKEQKRDMYYLQVGDYRRPIKGEKAKDYPKDVVERVTTSYIRRVEKMVSWLGILSPKWMGRERGPMKATKCWKEDCDGGLIRESDGEKVERRTWIYFMKGRIWDNKLDSS